LLNLALISYFYYRKNERIKNERLVNEKISALRYRALNAQMNPHFINNLIVNINDLANKGELNDVKDSLSKFAELVNIVLQSTKSNLISLNDEIKMSKLYLDLQKLRFNKKLQYEIESSSISSDELANILIPPMILQPIIENSIKHGFINNGESNKINIFFKIENNEFIICEITDNGNGINQNKSKISNPGISLKNINTRLQLISESSEKENFVFTTNLTDEFNTLAGTKVTLKIPLISF
jgi:LytS/YehU family sensor histidine kinase